MSKLHELLAVNSNLAQQADKVRADLSATFEKKRHLFAKKLVTFTPIEEGASAVTEEQSDIQTTVTHELEWITGISIKTIDTSHQIDVANTVAKADIVTEDGDAIATDVPATSLLQLEKQLKEVQALVTAIPTLDPAKGFVADEASGKGIYRARDVNKSRTRKDQKVITLAPATDKHPAQAQLVPVDVVTGTIREQEWSALLTPALKSNLLERCEVLVRAVKKARARANEVEVDVVGHKIGKALLGYVFKPLSS